MIYLKITDTLTVIHHSQSYEARERNFQQVYQAYLDGNIDETAMSFYLGRMYEFKHGRRFRMEGSFRSEDEINRLIQELRLK